MAELIEMQKPNAAAPPWLTCLVGALLLAVVAIFLLAAPPRIPSADSAVGLNMKSAVAAAPANEAPPA